MATEHIDYVASVYKKKTDISVSLFAPELGLEPRTL